MFVLRAAMEAQGLVERFMLRENALHDSYSPMVLLAIGVGLLLASVLVLKR